MASCLTHFSYFPLRRAALRRENAMIVAGLSSGLPGVEEGSTLTPDGIVAVALGSTGACPRARLEWGRRNTFRASRPPAPDYLRDGCVAPATRGPTPSVP